MPSLDTIKRIHAIQNRTGFESNGDIRKYQSDQIIEYTWNEDIGSKIAYMYDYYHDDEPLKNYKLSSNVSKTKTPIEIKFIINAYNSESKDQVGLIY